MLVVLFPRFHLDVALLNPLDSLLWLYKPVDALLTRIPDTQIQTSLTPSELPCPIILSYLHQAQDKISNQKQKPSTRWYYIQEKRDKKPYKPRSPCLCSSAVFVTPLLQLVEMVQRNWSLSAHTNHSKKLGRHEHDPRVLYHAIRASELVEKRMEGQPLRDWREDCPERPTSAGISAYVDRAITAVTRIRECGEDRFEEGLGNVSTPRTASKAQENN
jgi:hypothetical protein